MKRSEKADEILDIAEEMARKGGYNSFSFREIAKAVGVKSSSVHYHFPTKDELGAAVVQRYTDRFLDALGDPNDLDNPKVAIERYIDLYRKALVEDELMCLCGIMGAEIEALPPTVGEEAKHFFERNVKWLIAALSDDEASTPAQDLRSRSLHIIATLEGAMIVARSLEDHKIFESVVSEISIP
ncbi:MAG: TetR/AcrR family transcriptional regulator [Parasphingorhabdus sp.]